jgi:ubiquinone/menaquinone biosynthesis C-methylase UbiE
MIDADPIVEFFDKRAEDYDREYYHRSPGGYALRIRRQKVLDLFDKPGGKVLDVGCGPAVMTQDMLDRGCSFWGIDPSANMIGICRARFTEGEQVHFLSGHAMRLGLPENFFDAVLCMGVIDALKDRKRAISEMLRVLKPGGSLILTFTNLNSPYAWWKNYVFYPAVKVWHRLRGRLGDRTLRPGRTRSGSVRALYTRNAARQLLHSAGAEVIQEIGYYYNVFISPIDEMIPSLALAVTRKLEEGVWPCPEWLAAGFIVKARKRGTE